MMYVYVYVRVPDPSSSPGVVMGRHGNMCLLFLCHPHVLMLIIRYTAFMCMLFPLHFKYMPVCVCVCVCINIPFWYAKFPEKYRRVNVILPLLVRQNDLYM